MAVDFNNLWKKTRNGTDDAESVRTLAKILSSTDGRAFIMDLEPPDAELCLEILDHGLAEHKLHSSEKQIFFGTTWKLAGKHARLPNSMVITDEIDFSASSQLHISGGFADIKPGKYKGRAVAVKTLRVDVSDDFVKIRKQFCKEVILWNSLSHPNVLKLVGVLGGIEQYQFATVSEWMAHGNIMEYIKENATNRLELLHGAAQGLKYIHDANLIHGDLKGANILMTNDTPPRACLTDFGFTTMALDTQNQMSSSLTLGGGTMAFMAPELLAPSKFGLKQSVPTREADVYAFGLVILQVLTGEQPFHDLKAVELPYHVSLGVRPGKPPNAEAIGVSDSLWELIQNCWDGEKTRRPQIQEVVAGIGEAAASWRTDMPAGGTEHWEDSVTEEEPDEMKYASIFGPYQSSDVPAAGSSASASQFGSAHPLLTQSTDVETHGEHSELVFKPLDQNNSPPPTVLPRRKRKGFRYLMKKIHHRTQPARVEIHEEYSESIFGRSMVIVLSSSESSLGTLNGTTDFAELWTRVTRTPDKAEAVRTLAEILAQRKGRTFISRLEHKEAELCIEVLDYGVTRHNLKPFEKQAFFVTLWRLAGCHGRLPHSMMITEKIEVSDEVHASGRFADVRSGRYMGHLVAVKTTRVPEQHDLLKGRKQFCKEVILWRTLSHPNILKLVGVQGDVENGQFVTVSEWMTHGNIMEYVEKTSVNRLELLHGAAQGLKYLHDAGLAHGDLKGSNILVTDTPPRACLADFGFLTMVLSPDQSMSHSAQSEGGTIAFMSPERLVPSKFSMKDSISTPEADIYAFGLVIFHVLTGEVPFRDVQQTELGLSVVQGLRPAKPGNALAIRFSDPLWGFVQRCWDGDMKLRPKVAEVVTHLEKAAVNWDEPMPQHHGTNTPLLKRLRHIKKRHEAHSNPSQLESRSFVEIPATAQVQPISPDARPRSRRRRLLKVVTGVGRASAA